MAYIGQNLETKGVIMALLSLVLVNMSCEDKIGSPVVNLSEGEMVEVTLNIGLANEADGYTLSASSTTKSNIAAFNCALQPVVTTKGEEASLKPNKLYNLEIQQYDRSGNRYNNVTDVIAVQEIGSSLSLSLTADPDCQLVIIAWGNGKTTTRLGTGDLASAQDKSIDASAISELDPSNQNDMNQMPYVLHLEHVCVESNTIKSIEGKDVRLLLRRLATRLTLNWSYLYADYALKQILLQSIPTNYNVVAAPDDIDKTYPSLLDQFTTIQLTDKEINAEKYSCWIPANVRGTNPAATSQTYRTKSNAPTGSSYVDFIASKVGDAKKKLSYRVYLGGSEFSDFNLYNNTDYNYTVTINHTDLPVNDRRVTIIDPIPASQNNDNLVPTANCFMVAPGGAFCFDPYTYQQDGVSIANDTLKGWSDYEGGIAYVKLLWQTRENGDLGDPVMGVVNASDDHTNIVDIKRIDGNSLPATNKDQARIYCRVAPNTSGGSGSIAAYSPTGDILWSWHIWVTDYAPDSKGGETILSPEHKRKQKYVGNNATDQPPMMDRNLGAISGYVDIPQKTIEQSKTNGFHYQQGRKDPFPSSYSTESKSTVPNIYSTVPPKDMLNLYGPDGLTYKPRERGVISIIRDAYKNPIKMYTSSSLSDNQGRAWSGTSKTMHDPCPAGWRIAAKENYRALFVGDYYASSTVHKYTPRLAAGFNWDDGKKSGGYLIVYDNEARTTYFRMTGFGNNSNSFVIVGEAGNIWTRDHKVAFDFGFNANASNRPAYEVSYGWQSADAHATRCIQELE